MTEIKTIQENYLGYNRKHEIFVYADFISTLLDIDIEDFCDLSKKLWGEVKIEYTKWDILALIYYYGSLNCLNDKLNISNIRKLFIIAKLFEEYLIEPERSTFIYTKAAIIDSVNKVLIDLSTEKGYIHPWVKNNLESKYPGSKLIPVKAIQNKLPDFLINIDGIVYPVECKRNFTNSGLKQLQNYMKLWNVDKGIAVAAELRIELPSNIDFHLAPKSRLNLVVD